MLGTDNIGDIKSVTKTTYTGDQPANYTKVNKEQLRDFRASHFELSV